MCKNNLILGPTKPQEELLVFNNMPLAPALRGQSIKAEPDVVLLGDSDETEQIHSILLMTLSPYFNTILDNERHEKPIRICGADGEVLRMIKEYAYEGRITGLSKDNIEKVNRVADMYNIMGILSECQLFKGNTNIQGQ